MSATFRWTWPMSTPGLMATGASPCFPGRDRRVLRVLFRFDVPQQLRRALLHFERDARGEPDFAPLPRLVRDPVQNGGDLRRLEVHVAVVEGRGSDPSHVSRLSRD